MLLKTKSIINDLHEKGFYNTQDLDRFTVLCTAYKIGMPSIDTLYKPPSFAITPVMGATTESIRKIQEQVFSTRFNQDE